MLLAIQCRHNLHTPPHWFVTAHPAHPNSNADTGSTLSDSEFACTDVKSSCSFGTEATAEDTLANKQLTLRA